MVKDLRAINTSTGHRQAGHVFDMPMRPVTASLAGRGEVDGILTVDGETSNTVETNVVLPEQAFCSAGASKNSAGSSIGGLRIST